MSDDADSAAARREALAPYRIDDALLDRAAPHAFALHCLPAHPGEEITEDVLYGDRQRIWDQAENRRHAQKALLELVVSRAAPHGEVMPSLKKPTDLVVIPAEWLRDTLDAAVRRGRMTRDDATELLAELLRGRRAEEAAAEGFPLPGYDDLTAAQVIERIKGLDADA